MKQIFNPYLPSFECIPDGEPHVFGGRIYLYGSHDRFNGAAFCLNDYVSWSAPLDDLTDWRYEGVIFEKTQDPRNQNLPADAEWPYAPWEKGYIDPARMNPKGIHAMWAPDVAQGPDGRYYLFYCLDVLPEIGVAVCDTPAGRYEFLGFVRHADGTPLGQKPGDVVSFDPGVYVDGDGTVFLYNGNATWHKTDAVEGQRKHSTVMQLQPDMLTLKTEPRDLIPNIFESEGTPFEGHEFFEASSIRKINGLYYFVYSSVQSHELCYAVSDRADGEYRFGGTLVDIADCFLDGRTEAEALNAFGNTHGGMECVNGQWYIFYHRQTNRTQFSRQACAEKLTFRPDGSIAQAPVTSCGLNAGPLNGRGTYPARIACQLTRSGKNVMSVPEEMTDEYPFFTQDVPDLVPTAENIAADAACPFQYVANVKDGVTAGYKFFRFEGTTSLTLTLRGEAEGVITVSDGVETVGTLPIASRGNGWHEAVCALSVKDGVKPLYLTYSGTGRLDLRQFTLA